jgi:WXXGXW repeat (2 copies)
MRILRSLGLLLFTAAVLITPKASNAQIAVGISVRIGPPVLPVYAQPVCPAPGYIWTPGYWAYGDDDYYWVPGTWVLAPEPGLLWTPGYWGFADGLYIWHAGYWGPHVGFYGGINYGYGYTGVGFWGGEWRGREFAYNRSVTNVNTTIIHNTYNKTVIVNNTTINNVSYNGGPHGIQARATEQERIAEHERHVEARREQIEHEHAAHADRSQWASVNHGRPAVAASGRPGDFHRNVAAARAETANRPSSGNRPDRPTNGHADRPGNASSASRNVSRSDRPPNAGNRDAAGSRPSTVHSNNGRDMRDARSAPDFSRGRNQVAGESRGSSHPDRAPAQHANTPHESAPHSSNRPEQGKPEHGKPERP